MLRLAQLSFAVLIFCAPQSMAEIDCKPLLTQIIFDNLVNRAMLLAAAPPDQREVKERVVLLAVERHVLPTEPAFACDALGRILTFRSVDLFGGYAEFDTFVADLEADVVKSLQQ